MATSWRKVVWVGEPPATCQICNDPITTEFIDGRTLLGPWACMCPDCWPVAGVPPLGTNRGQCYRKSDTGDFVKVEG